MLRVGTTGNETPFLTEADLKDKEETRRKQAVRLPPFPPALSHQLTLVLIVYHSNLSWKEKMLKWPKLLLRQSRISLPNLVSQCIFEKEDSPLIDLVLAGSLPGPSIPPSASGGVSISESAIRQIVSVGFSQEEALAELQRTGGNVQLALTALLAKSITLN